MLVLTRKIDESIYIDDGAVRLTVSYIADDAADVSIAAKGGLGVLVRIRLDEPVDIFRPFVGRICSVMLTRVEAGRVRLGFDAPRRVVIDREEVFHLKNETSWSLTDGRDAATQRGEGREGIVEGDCPSLQCVS